MNISRLLSHSILVLIALTLSACLGGGGGGGSSLPSDYYHWNTLGKPGIGWGTATAIAIAPSDNKPIVTFRDMVEYKPRVMKWSHDEVWTDLGYLTASGGGSSSIVIDPSDNKPIVVFIDNINDGKARVVKWSSGTTWTDLGFASTGPSLAWHRRPKIAIDPSDNKPVVVFSDENDSYKLRVKKWDSGTTWTDLGQISTGVGYFPSIAIDPTDNKAVVAFIDVDSGRKARVMKWSSGTTWTDLGFISSGITAQTVMAMGTDGMPVVVFVEDYYDPSVYSDTSGDTKMQAVKYAGGTSWTLLGRLTNVKGEDPSIVIDPSDNKPVVSFRDWNSPIGTNTHVVKWSSGTTWSGMGWPSSHTSVGASLALDPSDNKPVVFYSDSLDGAANIYVAKHP